MRVLTFFALLLFFTNGNFAQDVAVCGYTNKKVITIQGSQITGGPHSDFPILIDHTDGANLTTAAAKVTSASGFDIIFADDNGDPLDFQLELYDGTAGQIVAWVRIPTVTNGTDVDIHMLYGKASVVTNQSSTSTWDSNFEAVMHLGESGNGTDDEFKDGTANGFDGTGGGVAGSGVAAGTPSQSAGKIGFGQDFDDSGTQDHIRLQAVPDATWTGVTVSAWIFPHDNGDDRIFGKSWGTGTNQNTWLLRKSVPGSQSIGSRMRTNTNNNGGFDPFGYSINTWYLATVTWDGSTNTLAVYVNGTLSNSTTLNGVTMFTAPTTDLPTIGNTTTLNRGFDGIIDEPRVASIARSANWIATTYDAENNPEGTFYTIGNEVNNTIASSNNGDWDDNTRWNGSVVPSVGANVTINHTIDIDAGSDDYTICNCTISNTAGGNSDVDMDDARVLTIIEDLTLVNTNNSEIDITLDDNGTTINVLGDVIMTNSSSGARDIQIDLDNATVFDVVGDLTMSMTSGDVVEIDLTSTADMNIGGNVLIDQDGGNDSYFYVDENSTADIAGNFTIDHDGGDDVFVEVNDNVNGSATLTIEGNFVIDHNDGDDIEIRVDDAGSTLQVNGNFSADLDAADDDDIIFNLDGGNFNVNGTTELTRRNNFHEISFDMDNGNFTSGTLTTNNLDTDAGDHSIWLSVDATSVFTVNGDININQTGGNNTHIRANTNAGAAAQVVVNGNVNIDHDGGSDILLHSSGANSVFDINGNVNIDHDGGNNIQLHSLGTNSIFDISGTFVVDHDAGNQIEIQTNGANSQFNVGSTTTVNWNDGAATEFEIDANDGAIFFTGAFFAARGLSTGEIQLNLDGGDVTFNTGSTFNSNGALFTSGAIDFRIDGGSVFTNTGDMSILMNGGDDLNIFIDVDGAGTNSQFLCTGDLLVSRVDGDDIDIRLDNDNSFMDIDGDFTIVTTGGEDFDILLNSDATLNVDGSMTYTGIGGQAGLVSLLNAGTPSLDIGNDFIITMIGGSAGFSFALGGGEIIVGRDMTFSQTTGASLMYIDADGGDLSVTRDFLGNLSGGNNTGELWMDLDNGSIMTVGDDFTFNLNGGNDIEFYIENFDVTGTAQLNVTGNMTFDHNGATGGDDIQFVVSDNGIVTVGGDFTMDTDGSGSAGNFYTRINNTSLLDVDGDIYMTSPAADFLEVTLNNTSKLEIEGDFIRQAGPNNFGLLNCNDASTIEYNGNSTQLFAEDAGAGTDQFFYQNVIINNTFGTIPQLTMEGLATVHGDITFADGIIETTSTNLLVIDDDSDALTESDNSFVDGPVKKIGNDQFDFPTGDDGQLQQISISAPGLVTDEFTAQYIENDPHPTFNELSKDVSIDHISSCEYWTLDRTIGASDVQVTLNYDANSCGVTDLSSLIVARWDGTTWRDQNGTVAGSLVNGTVQTPLAVSSAYIADMPFTLASTNANNPLPIKLLKFNAISNGNAVDLSWITASESNNDYFTVERSKNGQEWESIITKPGAGNSTTKNSYFDIDVRPHAGISYYRLKQTDFDGVSEYFEVVTVIRTVNNQFVVYPNPNINQNPINILLPDGIIGLDLQVNIIDILGRNIFSETFINGNKSNIINLDLNKSIPSGTYIISVVYLEEVFYQKLIIE
ncbi:MAG: DUF2341 domain-containing protein [Crocinitomicaceae bacterium]